MKTITFDCNIPGILDSERFREAWSTAVDSEPPCIKVQGLEFNELKVSNLSFDGLASICRQYKETEEKNQTFFDYYKDKGFTLQLTLVKTPPAQEK